MPLTFSQSRRIRLNKKLAFSRSISRCPRRLSIPFRRAFRPFELSFHFANRPTSRSPVPFSGHGPFRPDSNPSRFALPRCAFNHAGNSRADSSPFTQNPLSPGRAVYENPPKSRREHLDFSAEMHKRVEPRRVLARASPPRRIPPRNAAALQCVCAIKAAAQKPEKLRAPRDKMRPSATGRFF